MHSIHDFKRNVKVQVIPKAGFLPYKVIENDLSLLFYRIFAMLRTFFLRI